ncbi:hypothetical protein ZOSMA_52G01370 [Zostera marina]|uniref:DNA topoisomerase type IA zn finger domain-containing protein n=1 Tax=Zostera marina TaxID=29655 RepID=A0A0K9NZR9_ZOSMR|nr:hypothetical protein ZOSMA_52G01370 [Zostera marina]
MPVCHYLFNFFRIKFYINDLFHSLQFQASTFLSLYFSEISDHSFTVNMENELDKVSFGKTEWKSLLKDYWTKFKNDCDLVSDISPRELENKLEKKFGHVLFNQIGVNNRACPSCLKGTMVFKISKFGSGYFIGCDQHPKCKYTFQSIILSEEEEEEENDDLKPDNCFQPKLLGQSPSTKENIFLKNGPYGYYIQLGDDRKECPPKRVPVEEKVIESLTLEDAMDFLRYPILLGDHPKDAAPVSMVRSKRGVFIKYRNAMAKLSKKTNPKSITLEAAVELLKGKNVKMSGPRVSKPEYKGIVLKS